MQQKFHHNKRKQKKNRPQNVKIHTTLIKLF